MKRQIYIGLGLFFTVIGLIGVVVPLLPTTPFLLLAAYFFSRSSQKLYHLLIKIPEIGPAMERFRCFGVINRQSKQRALFCMGLVVIFIYGVLKIPWWGKIGASTVIVGVGVFIYTRPELKPELKIDGNN